MATGWEDLVVMHDEPNCTVILPGPCQARCAFCVEPVGPAPSSNDEWLKRLELLLDTLPKVFRVLSLSGGEPTLSPVFGQVLEMLGERGSAYPMRFHRVVLTTNAHPTSFERHLPGIGRAITHVNISRHAVDERDNRRVFRLPPKEHAKNRIPTLGHLRGFIGTLTSRGIPVNLNCVYSEHHFLGRHAAGVERDDLRGRALSYIAMARELGATSVVFRHDHRDFHRNEPTWLERLFQDHQSVHEASCNSCRVVTKLIDGLPVNFKRSAYEPTKVHQEQELYELIFHTDGTLARDWGRKKTLSLPVPAFTTNQYLDMAAHSKGPLVLVEEECSDPHPCGPVSAVSEEILQQYRREQ
jgi:hypothetical protein